MMLDAIADDLVARYGCHTVILYGSRAEGTSTEESDWDFACVRRERAGSPWPVIHEGRSYRDAAIDTFVYGERALDRERIDEGMLRLRGGKVVVDREGFGRALLRLLDEIEAEGPPTTTAIARETSRTWADKMLARIERGDAEAHYRRAQLLAELLPTYFHMRDLWYRGSKRALAWLAANDRDGFDAFTRALPPDASQEAVRALVACIFAPSA